MLDTERLRRLRTGKAMTQAQIASLIGVERTTYVRYENGDIQPPIDVVTIIAGIYGVTTDYLLGLAGEHDSAPPVLDDEALELMEHMHKRPELRVLFDTSKKASRKDIEMVDELLKRMVRDDDD